MPRMASVEQRPVLQQVASDDPHQPGGGNTGGGGDLVDYRLGELERRVGNLEESVGEIQKAVTAVQEQMKSVATKYWVSLLFGGVVVVQFLGVLTHLLIRSMGP